MINDNAYYQVQYWMIKLGLKGLKLQIYAIIYGFSQGDQGIFCGTNDDIAKLAGCHRVNVNKALKEMVRDGYLKKEILKDNGGRPGYIAVTPIRTTKGGQNVL